MKMRKIYLMGIIIAVHLISVSVFAQGNILHDPVSTKMFNSERFSNIKGSPFLFEKWIKGSVITSKGVYENIELKFDVYSNSLFFLKNDEPYEFQEAVSGFTLMPVISDTSTYLVYTRGVSGNGLSDDQFVQTLVRGKVSLYKSEIKLLSEVNEINVGLVKTFTNSTRYFVVKDDNIQLLKLNKKEVLSLFKNDIDQVQTYIKENKLALTKETDIVRLIRYYNAM